MKKVVSTASEKAGLPPGSVVLVAEKAESTKITLELIDLICHAPRASALGNGR